MKSFAALRTAVFIRFCKRLAKSFDLIISTISAIHLDSKGIQFITNLTFDDNVWREKGSASTGYFYKDNLVRRGYMWMVKLIQGRPEEGFKKNLTIANSKWTARILEEKIGVQSLVVYPPVIGDFPDIPWNEKEAGFVFIGRLVPEKRVENIIEIVENVRDKWREVHLHIVGQIPKTRYGNYIKRLVASRENWIKLEGLKYKEEKKNLLSRHKFGINAHPNEPFGVSVAEMVKAGCIVWVPNGGGQAEIVNHLNLQYINNEDAVNKIIQILKNEEEQTNLRGHLRKQAENFSIQKFKQEIKSIVDDFF